MTTIAKPVRPTVGVQPRVLIVDDETSLLELVSDVCARNVQCKLLSARTLAEARGILSSQPVELVVIDVHLPDGDGLSLLPVLARFQPQAAAIVMTGSPSVDGAISALRQGAMDFLPKPFDAQHLTERVRKALTRQALQARGQRRLLRLRDAVHRLNEARKLVSRKVDLLCNDLIGAYSELSHQLDAVRNQEGFRKFLSQARDLEQLLCHAMDWLLRQMGYCNIGVWLASQERDFQLGAYMKYTIPGDNQLVDAMKLGLVPMVAREGFVHLSNEELGSCLTSAERDQLMEQTLLASSCSYLGDTLAVVTLFRHADTPFTEQDATVLKAVSPIFAVALASMVRGSQDPAADDPDEADGPEDGDGPRRDRGGDSDWWKRGEEPPF